MTLRAIELVDRAKAGDRPAFEALLQETRESARAMALRHLHDVDASEDVAQEVASVVWKRVTQLRDCGAMRSWLQKVTLNAIRQHLRREHTRDRRLLLLRREVRHSDPRGFLDRLAHPETVNQVKALVATLPRAQRSALALVVFEGMTHVEAAAYLGVRTPTVRSNLSRARTAVRRGWCGRSGPDCDETVLAKSEGEYSCTVHI